MSKVGSTNIIGQMFKPIITNATYDELNNLKVNNTALTVHNAIIFSVPIDSEGNDIENTGSIWLTDSDGYLYCMSKPIN